MQVRCRLLTLDNVAIVRDRKQSWVIHAFRSRRYWASLGATSFQRSLLIHNSEKVLIIFAWCSLTRSIHDLRDTLLPSWNVLFRAVTTGRYFTDVPSILPLKRCLWGSLLITNTTVCKVTMIKTRTQRLESQ